MSAQSSQSPSEPSINGSNVISGVGAATMSAVKRCAVFQSVGDVDRVISYWSSQLMGIPAILELPTDRPRPSSRSLRSASESLLLSQELKTALQKLSDRECAPIPVVLLAAFQVLLTRYTRQDDIVVGSVITDTCGLEIQAPYAAGAAALPIRTDMSGDLTFRELLVRVRDTVGAAVEHANVSWERLVECVEPDRDASRHPIFQAMFSLEDSASVASVGQDGRDNAIDSDLHNVDLWLRVCEQRDGLLTSFAYSTDLFNADTIQRMARHFRQLLEGTVVNSGEHISRLPLLTESEQSQILFEWNDTWTDYPRERCVHELFEAQAARRPEAIAVVLENGYLTYRELNRRANQLARYLVKRGVGPNVLVGICVERSLEMVVGLLGILKAGGAYVPVDPAFPSDRIAFMLEDAEAPVLLTQEHLAETLPGGRAERIRLDADWVKVATESGENLSRQANSDDLAYTMYTSGSTGKPKGVQIPHRAVVNFLISMAQKPGMAEHDRLLAVTTLSFDIAGLEIYLPLAVGASLEIVGRSVCSDGNQLLAKLLSSGTTVMQATPATWRMLLEAGWHGSPGLKILVGGEAVPSKLAKQLIQRAGSVWNVYGPTETTIWSTVRKFEPGEDGVSIGRPIANTEIFILDALLQPVPIGVAGELMIGGEGLARGYFKRTDLTAEKFIPHPFRRETGARVYRTGDLARYLPNGEIEFLGRIDYQVKIRGFRIELGEIEAVLREHPGVQETVVVAHEVAAGDQRLVAYFVPIQGSAVRPIDLRKLLSQRLPKYMLPSAFVSLPKMPLTPNGKINRKALPVPEHFGPAAEEELVEPRDAIESQLVTIWESVLGVHPIGISHDFFELGGHSLLAIKLITYIEEAFGQRLAVATLFQARTVAQMAMIIRQGGCSPKWSSLVPIQVGGSNPPFFCVHGAGGVVILFYELARYLGPEQPVYGLQARGLDEKSPCQKRVEDMAAHYLHEMRSIQPHGPYYIGGYSFGGMVALEIAQQLKAQGEDTALTVLFDTFCTCSRRSHADSMALGERLSSALLKVWRSIRDEADALQMAQILHRGMKRRWLDLKVPHRLKRVRRACEEAARNYAPKTYSGKVLLYRSSRPPLGYDDPYEGWNQYIEHGLETCEIQGNHDDILLEPRVRTLAEHLKDRLDHQRSLFRTGVVPPLAIAGQR